MYAGDKRNKKYKVFDLFPLKFSLWKRATFRAAPKNDDRAPERKCDEREKEKKKWWNAAFTLVAYICIVPSLSLSFFGVLCIAGGVGGRFAPLDPMRHNRRHDILWNKQKEKKIQNFFPI